MNAGTQTATSAPLSTEEAHAIGLEAYVYLYPLVTMEMTRRQMTNLPDGVKPGYGPANAFSHVRAFPPAEFKVVVRPNFDTLYSSAWLDLTAEPLIVSAPDAAGRYYLLPMLDMWTDVFAAPGKRTTGTAPGHYMVTPPGWQGAVPKGVEVIEAPTPYVWIIGRTQTNGPADYAAVGEFQDGLTITPLSQLSAGREAVEAHTDPAVDMDTPSLDQVNAMSAGDYFALGADLMKLHPPHLTDWSTLARMGRLGLRPGHSFDPSALEPAVRSGLDSVPAEAQQLLHDKLPTLARVVNGWQMNTDTMGVYGNYYLKRAIVTMVGLGANQPEDAVYPLAVSDAEGKPLDGNASYVLHFDADELPPVDAFWSVTMYDDEGFQVANELDRFAIGDRDPLVYNDDGSLDLYLQNENPGPDKQANWLPAPRTPLGVTMRLYAPRPEALDGRWAPPPVRKV